MPANFGQFALGVSSKVTIMNPEWCWVPKKDWLERTRPLNSLWLPVVTFTVPMVVAFFFEWYRTPEIDIPMRGVTFIGGAVFFVLTGVFGFFFWDDRGKRIASITATNAQELTDWSVATVIVPPGKRVELVDQEQEPAAKQVAS